MGATKTLRQQRVPVDITFAVRDFSGYLEGSLVSSHLRLLTMVEFSFYVGFPVLQIAERQLNARPFTSSSWELILLLCILGVLVVDWHIELFLISSLSFTAFHYPELNVSQVLQSSWVKTGRLLHDPVLVPRYGPSVMLVCVCALQCCWACWISGWVSVLSMPGWRGGWLCCWGRCWGPHAVGRGPLVWEITACRYYSITIRAGIISMNESVVACKHIHISINVCYLYNCSFNFSFVYYGCVLISTGSSPC